jgi:hypothetical protein
MCPFSSMRREQSPILDSAFVRIYLTVRHLWNSCKGLRQLQELSVLTGLGLQVTLHTSGLRI